MRLMGTWHPNDWIFQVFWDMYMYIYIYIELYLFMFIYIYICTYEYI